jgi:endoglucanase
MKPTLVFLFKIKTILFIIFLPHVLPAQSVAWQRANDMGKGINLSWMEHYWEGTEKENRRDYLKLEELPYYKKQIALLHDMGFQVMRLPVCFDLWYAQEYPYTLLKPQYYEALDSIITWTAEKNMLLIIDNHHGVLTNEHLQADLKKSVALWKDVTKRYKHSDTRRILFELFNEPSEISPENWRTAAQALLSTVRKQLPHHTLIIGASEWNSLEMLNNMPLFSDHNIIYTFHFYDPFLYTHQGADWVGDGVATIGMPYPYRSEDMPTISPKTASTWAAGNFERYPQEANYEALSAKIKTIKDWSQKHNVPVFCGEWGAYKPYAIPEDRCEYLNTMYTILNDLKIPNAMWEWDGSFSFFKNEPSKEQIYPCMKGIVERNK